MTGYRKGFTLLELLVAVGIFSLILLVMSSVYTRFVASQRRQIGEQIVQQDLRFALELFQHEARTAYASSFALTDGTGTSFVFRNQNGTCVNYRQSSVTLVRAEEEISSGPCRLTSNRSIRIVSKGTHIDYLRFDPVPATIGPAGGLTAQGFVTVIMRASAAQSPASAWDLQTSVASRQLQPYEQ